jgi:hypothetical protein
MMSVIPTRNGSKHSGSIFPGAAMFIYPLERGRRAFLKTESEKIRKQYCAIEDRDARGEFLLERQLLVRSIEEVSPGFLVSANTYIC